MTSTNILCVICMILIVCLVPTSAQVRIQFVDTDVKVEEGKQFELRLRRLGDISNIVNVIVIEEDVTGTVST